MINRCLLNMLLIQFVMIIVFTNLTGCEPKKETGYVINDFETDSDLDRLNWKCHTLFSLSYGLSTHGMSSLKVEMYPSLYPGVSLKINKKNWTGYHNLIADIINPVQNGNLEFVLRIDDSDDAPEYDNRFNGKINLKVGINHLVIPLETLVTPSGRPLDLAHIYTMIFFMAKPEKKVIVYMDNVRLTN